MCHYIRHNRLLSSNVGYKFSLYQSQKFYPNTAGCTLSIYQAELFDSHPLFFPVSLYQTQEFYQHPLLVTLCQCIRDNSLSAHTVGCNVSEYMSKKFPQNLLVILCLYIRSKSCILNFCWLQSVRISEITFLNSQKLGYNMSVYHNK